MLAREVPSSSKIKNEKQKYAEEKTVFEQIVGDPSL